jgi:hypothetical protein
MMTPSRTDEAHFAVCLRNEEAPASLETRKLYRVIADADATSLGMLRVVDESGEDYLYPADDFHILVLSPDVEAALLKAS